MKLHILLSGAFLALAACSGNGDIGLGGGDGGDGGVGDGGGGDGGGGADTCPGAFVCTGDVIAVTFDPGPTGAPGDDTLTLTGLPWDDAPVPGVYTFFGTQNGYNVYENTLPGTFNSYLAIYDQSAGGEIEVGVTKIEGYLDFGYGGTFALLNDPATLPALGLTEFTGLAAGLTTYDTTGARGTTTGVILMQVDLTDNKVRGEITGRAEAGGAGGALPGTLVLNDADIAGGSFAGTVNSYDAMGEVLETGTYNGQFAGGSGDHIGGFYEAVNPEYDPDITSQDSGIFILDNCGGPCP